MKITRPACVVDRWSIPLIVLAGMAAFLLTPLVIVVFALFTGSPP
jgi:hypothetical protein